MYPDAETPFQARIREIARNNNKIRTTTQYFHRPALWYTSAHFDPQKPAIPHRIRSSCDIDFASRHTYNGFQ